MTQYDPELSDDEWREANFPTDVIHSAARLGHVASADGLIKYAEKHGPDSILDCAIMLGQESYRKVEKALRKLPAQRRTGRRRAA